MFKRSEKRPEYVKCISDTHADKFGLTLCGRSFGAEFTFTGIDHAFNTARSDDRLLVCLECAVVAAVALIRHTENR